MAHIKVTGQKRYPATSKKKSGDRKKATSEKKKCKNAGSTLTEGKKKRKVKGKGVESTGRSDEGVTAVTLVSRSNSYRLYKL